VITRVVFLLVLVVSSALFLLHIPAGSLSGKYPYLPELAHVVLFFMLAASMHLAFRPRIWVSFLLLMGYGLVIEAIQYYLPTRVGQLDDMIPNAVGACMFYLYLLLQRITRRR